MIVSVMGIRLALPIEKGRMRMIDGAAKIWLSGEQIKDAIEFLMFRRPFSTVLIISNSSYIVCKFKGDSHSYIADALLSTEELQNLID